MGKLKEREVVSTIHIDNNLINMIIAETTSHGSFRVLDKLHRNCSVGEDVYTFGKVTVNTVQEICEIIKGYLVLMKDYKIKKYKIIATGALKEATNREFVLEQIRIKCDSGIEIINNSQERYYLYKAIWEELSKLKTFKEDEFLIINYNDSCLEISVYKNGRLNFTEYIDLEIFTLKDDNLMENSNVKFSQILSEYINNKLVNYKLSLLKMKLKGCMFFTHENSAINKLLKYENIITDNYITNEIIDKLYKDVCGTSPEALKIKYELSNFNINELLATLIIYKEFLKLIKSGGIYTSSVTLAHGGIAHIIDSYINTKRNEDALEDIMSSTWCMATKYKQDKNHCETLERYSVKIFQTTKKIHDLGSVELLYLRISAILHSVGNYISVDKYGVHNYNMILDGKIIGFSKEEIHIIASIAKLYIENKPITIEEDGFRYNVKNKILINKLAALLKVSHALDISQKGKIKDIDIKIYKREVIVEVTSLEDLMLEKWAFNNSRKFFEDVFGYKLMLSRRGKN